MIETMRMVLLNDLQKEATVFHLIKSVSGINHLAAAEAGLMQKDKDRRLGKKNQHTGHKMGVQQLGL